MVATEQQPEEVHKENESCELDSVAVGDAAAVPFGVVLDCISSHMASCGEMAGVVGYEDAPTNFSIGVGDEFRNNIAAPEAGDIAVTEACTQRIGDRLKDTNQLPNLIAKGFDR